MAKFYISIGEKVIYNNQKAIITRVVDLDTVTIEEVQSHTIRTVKIYELKPYNDFETKDLTYEIGTLSDEKWEIAQKRYDIIKPILSVRKKKKLIDQISSESEISVPM